MDMNNIYSSFGFIDLFVFGCGLYGLYSWHMLVHKHEIKKTLLVGGNSTPEQCVDIEGFAGFMGPKLIILSAAMIIFGAISGYNSFIADIGIILWIAMALFLAIIVWYCVQLRKADSMYFNVNGKSGKSIKDKALKR